MAKLKKKSEGCKGLLLEGNVYQLHNVSDETHDQDWIPASQHLWPHVARKVHWAESKWTVFRCSCSACATQIVDSGDDTDRFMGLLTADANCLRDLHTHVLAVCQIRALQRKAYLEELLLIGLLAPCHLEAVIVSIGRLDRWGSSGARQEATY